MPNFLLPLWPGQIWRICWLCRPSRRRKVSLLNWIHCCEVGLHICLLKGPLCIWSNSTYELLLSVSYLSGKAKWWMRSAKGKRAVKNNINHWAIFLFHRVIRILIDSISWSIFRKPPSVNSSCARWDHFIFPSKVANVYSNWWFKLPRRVICPWWRAFLLSLQIVWWSLWERRGEELPKYPSAVNGVSSCLLLSNTKYAS